MSTDKPNEAASEKKTGVSRRQFVAGTVGGLVVGAVAGAAVGSLGFPKTKTVTQTETETSTATATSTMTASSTAQYSFLTPPTPIPASQISKVVSADIVVIGAGTAGLVCATAAAQAGAKVALFAQSSAPVGRGGSNHAYNSALMQKLGLAVDVSEDFKKIMADNGYRIDQSKWWLWYQKSGEAINWLSDLMVAAGYTPVIERGWTDPDANIFTMGIGSHSWLGNGVTSAGSSQPNVVTVLAAAAQAAGVTLDYSTGAQYLVRENNNTGRVTSVIAQAPDGTYVQYAGSKAIVIATGDFTADKEMMAAYCPWAAGLPGGIYTGQGHKMALWVGAAWQNIQPNAPMMIAVFSGPGLNVMAPNPYQFPPCMVVNSNGVRFMNEDTMASFGAAAMTNQPNQTAYAIWDTAYAQSAAPWLPFGSYYGPQAGQASPPTAVSDVISQWQGAASASPPTISQANTIDDLAAALKLPSAALNATVSAYNGYCASGVDQDFGKRSGLLFPVSTPPYYGSVGTPSLLIATGGLRTNVNMQVLDNNGNVIPGLYTVGTPVGDMYEGIYTFQLPGQNLGSTCVTFGYVAGQYIPPNEPGSA